MSSVFSSTDDGTNTKSCESLNELLENILKLETEKFRLLQNKGAVSIAQLQDRLKSLEKDISVLNLNESTSLTPKRSSSPKIDIITSSTSNKIELSTTYSDDDLFGPILEEVGDDELSPKRNKSNDVHDKMFSPKKFLDKLDKPRNRASRNRNSIGEHINHTISSDGAISQRESISTRRGSFNQSHRMSIGGSHHHHHPSQPLYTLPNAFKYDIKLRDANTNIGNIVDSSTSPNNTTDNRSSLSMSMVLGSRERRSDIRHVTDRLSVLGIGPLNTAEVPHSYISTQSEKYSNLIATTTTSTAAGYERDSAATASTMINASNVDSNLKALCQAFNQESSNPASPMVTYPTSDLTATTITGISADGYVTTVGTTTKQSSEVTPSGTNSTSVSPVQTTAFHSVSSGSGDEFSSDGDNDDNENGSLDSILEFCIVEADFTKLITDDLKFISPLLPSKEKYRYPEAADDKDDTNTQLIQHQNFFFPSGVQVDFVTPSVVPLYTKKCNYKRHIVPFMDTKGTPTYACCLTVTQAYSLNEIMQIDDKIITNLIRINKMKHAVVTIQKVFRQYVAHVKARNWTNMTNGTTPSHTGTSSSTSRGNHRNSGKFAPTTPTANQSVGSSQSAAKPGLFSRLFRRGSATDVEMDSSAHPSLNSAVDSQPMTPIKDSVVAPLPGQVNSTTASTVKFSEPVANTVPVTPKSSFFSRRPSAVPAAMSSDSSHSASTTSSKSGASNPQSANTPSLTADSVILTPKQVILDLLALNRLDTEDLNEIFSLILDIVNNPSSKGVESLLNAIDNMQSTLTDDLSGVITSESSCDAIRNRILNLIQLNTLQTSDLDVILSAVTEKSNTSTPRNSLVKSAASALISMSSNPSDKQPTITTMTPEKALNVSDDYALAAKSPGYLSCNPLEMAAALRESLNTSLCDKYYTDRVVIAQKAYCIVTSVAEYTFIFKVLDAIAEAESVPSDETEHACIGNTSNRATSLDRFVKNPIGVSGVTGLTTTISTEDSDELSPTTKQAEKDFAAFVDAIEDNEDAGEELLRAIELPVVPLTKKQYNRQWFLSEVEAYMFDYYCNNNNAYQVQDLALNFTVSKRINADGQTVRNSAENANKVLSKYASLAEAEKQQNKSINGSNWTTPAQSMSDPNQSRLTRTISQKLKNGANSNSVTNGNVTFEDSRNRDDSAVDLAGAHSAKSADFNGKRTPMTRGRSASSSSLVRGASRYDSTSTTGGVYDPCDGRYHINIPDYIDSFVIDRKSLLTTKEWSCAVLFAHLNSQVVFKIINLLLMEKSLIIYGKNPGIVTTITLAVINLISPFVWEGIFVPLVPDNARELFGAPVPLILGTISPPRIADVSTSTAILYLNDDTVIHTTVASSPKSRLSSSNSSASPNVPSVPEAKQNEFLAWFVRLPEVVADMPLDEEISKRIDYVRLMICSHYIGQMEFVDKVSVKSNIYNKIKAADSTTSSHVKNTLDSLLMSDVPGHILKQVQIVITAIKRSNFNFCGNTIKDPGAWKKFLRFSTTTGEAEFYPEYFMEPLRNYLEFQEAMVHTQLFVAFMDKLKKEQQMLEHVSIHKPLDIFSDSNQAETAQAFRSQQQQETQ